MSTNTPQRWERAPIGSLGSVITGSTPPTTETHLYGGDVPFVRPPDLRAGPIGDTETKLSALGADVARVVPEGSILVCCIGSLGKVGVAQRTVAFNQQINAVYPAAPAMSRWLLYAFQQSEFIESLASNSSSTTIAIINKSRFSALTVPVAPIPEQRRIVEAIESYFTRLDDAVATLERVERNLKRYRASVLKSAVEGRLVPTEAALAKQEGRTYEPASVLLERILTERRRRWSESGKKGKYQEPTPPDTTNLPKLSEGWCWATLEQLCSTVTDGDHLPPPQTESGIPFLVIGNVRNGDVDLSETRFVSADYYKKLDSTRRPQFGDILYTVTGSFGIPVLVTSNFEFCVQRHIAILRPLPTVRGPLLRRLLGSQFVFTQAAAIATGTAQKTVPLKGLRRIIVPLAPAKEQERISLAIERHLSMTDFVNGSVCHEIRRCARLRQSILKWAFEGKLADQDPTDEPASVLLERLDAERDNAKPAKVAGPQRKAAKKKARE